MEDPNKVVRIHGVQMLPITPEWGKFVTDIKQKVLLFDSVGVLNPQELLHYLRQERSMQAIQDVEMLLSAKEMFDTRDVRVDVHEISVDNNNFEQKVIRKGSMIGADCMMKNPETMKDFASFSEMGRDPHTPRELRSELATRGQAILWNAKYEVKKDEFIPILQLSNLPKFKNPKVDVYKVMFENMPIPHPETPVEHILEFKSNKDNEGRLLQFRSLINKLSKSGYNELEIQQEINHLMHIYTQSMQKHKIKSISGTLDVVVNAALSPITKILEKVIKITTNQVNLSSAELSYPGREISYMYKAKQMFGPQ